MKKSVRPQHRPQTRAIHAGEPPRHGVGAPVSSAIVRSSTFTLSSTEELKLWAEGKSKAFMYTRDGNPTLVMAAKKIAALEGAEDARADAGKQPPASVGRIHDRLRHLPT